VFLLAAAPSADAAGITWYVNDTSVVGDAFTFAIGSDSNAGTDTAPFATIAMALQAATAGDSILIDSGIYYPASTLFIETNGITLVGKDSASTIIDGNYARETGIAVLGAANVTFRNLQIARVWLDGGMGNNVGIGVALYGAASPRFENVGLNDLGTAIYAFPGTDSLTVANSRFWDNNPGAIMAETSPRVSLVGNKINDGVTLYGSDSAYIVGNETCPLVLENSRYFVIENNTLRGDATLSAGSSRGRFYNNTMLATAGGSALTVNGSENEIDSNLITRVGGTSVTINGETNTITRNTANGGTGGGGVGYGFHINGHGNTLRENVASGKCLNGYRIDGTYNLFETNVASGCGTGGTFDGCGFRFVLGADANLLHGNVASGNSYAGFSIETGAQILINNRATATSGGPGFALSGASAVGNRLVGNRSDSNIGYALSITVGATGNIIAKNNFITAPTKPDSLVLYNGTAPVDLTRNWFNTIDNLAIRSKIKGTGADSVLFVPYRLGAVDTTVNADTVAPAAPASVTAAGLDTTTIRVTWAATGAASEEPEAANGLNGYRIWRAAHRPDAERGWLVALGTVDAGTTLFDDTGRQPGVTYHYRVTAFDNHAPLLNESFFSDSIPAGVTAGIQSSEIPANQTGQYDTVLSGVIGTDTGYSLAQNNVDTLVLALPNAGATETWNVAIDFPDTGNQLLIRRVQASEMAASNTSRIQAFAKGQNLTLEIVAFDSTGAARPQSYWTTAAESPVLTFQLGNSGLRAHRATLYWLNTADSTWYDVRHSDSGMSRGQYTRTETMISIPVDHFTHFFPGEGTVDTVSVAIADTIASRALYSQNPDTHLAMALLILGDTGATGDTITRFAIANRGNATDTAVDTVVLWHSSTGAAVLAPTDTLIGLLTYDSIARQWRNTALSYFVNWSSAQPGTFLVSFRLRGQATNGETFQAYVPAASVKTELEDTGPASGEVVNPGVVTFASTIQATKYLGPQAGFEADSIRLANQTWIEAGGETMLILAARETEMPLRVRVLESSGLGETVTVALDTTSGTGTNFVVLGETPIIGGVGQLDANILFAAETNLIRITITSPTSGAPTSVDTGRLFIDFTPPTFTDSSRLINGVDTYTRSGTVTLTFTAAGVSDTGPGGVTEFDVSASDTFGPGPGTWLNTRLSGDTQYAIFPPSIVNSVATLYFRFKDKAENVSETATATIRVFTDSNVICVNDTDQTGDIFTSAGGGDDTGTGRPDAPFRSIGFALSIARAGETILVDAGAYYPASVLRIETNAITIAGKDSTATVIDGNYQRDTVVAVSAFSGVTIRDLSIARCWLDDGMGNNIGNGITLYGATAPRLINLGLTEHGTAIYAAGGTDSLSVTGSRFWSNNPSALVAETSPRLSLINNRIHEGQGVEIRSGSDSAYIVGNDTCPLSLEGSRYFRIENNTFRASLTLGVGASNGHLNNNTMLNFTPDIQGDANEIDSNLLSYTGGTSISISGDTNTITRNLANGGTGGVGVGYGFQVASSANGNIFRENTASGKWLNGFRIDGTNNLFETNTASNCGIGSSLDGCGFRFVNDANANVLVGNVASGNRSAGFSIETGAQTFIANRATATIDGPGFQLAGAAVIGNRLSQNRSDSNIGYALSISAGAASNTIEKNNLIPSPSKPDSLVLHNGTANINLTRNWLDTVDSALIRSRIKGTGADSIIYSPFRLGLVDTAAGADTVAPRAPDTVAVTGSGLTATVSWAASAGSEEVEAAANLTGYRVYRALSATDTTWTQVGAVAAGTHTYADTTLQNNTAYFFRVTAFDNHPTVNEAFYSDSIVAYAPALPIAGRVFFGPPSGSFETDSAELVGGQWISSTETLAIQPFDSTTLNIRMKVIDPSLVADTVSVYVDSTGAFVLVHTDSIPAGVAVIDLLGRPVLKAETNLILVLFGDTGVPPSASDSKAGAVFVDLVAPTVATVGLLIETGAIGKTNQTVWLTFGAAGVADTGPYGVTSVLVSDSPDFTSETRAFASTADTFYTIASSAIPETGLVTLYFRFADKAGHATIVSDTIIIDTVPPVAASLIAPANALATKETTIAFTWVAAQDTHTGLAGYRLQIDTTVAFTSMVADSSTGLETAGVYSLAGNKTYYWRILATDNVGISTPSETRSFSIDTLATVALSAPADSAIQDSRPVFQWTGSGTETYVWQIDTAADFSSIIDSLTLTGLLHQPIQLDSGTYYWRVIAYDRVGNFDTATARYLVIDTDMQDSWPPNAFSVTAPANLHETNTTTILFSWTLNGDSGTGVASYRLMADTIGGTFVAPVRETTVSALTNSAPLTLYGTETFVWLVAAIDGKGNTTVADTPTLRVIKIDTTPPVAAVPLAPANDLDTNATTIVFTWTAASDTHSAPVTHRLQIDTAGTFANLVADSYAGSETAGAYALAANDTYYWRILATDNAGCTAASTSNLLRVDTTPPGMTMGVSPLVNSTQNTTTVAFSWNAANDNLSGLLEYRLQIDTAGTFAVMLYQFTETSGVTADTQTLPANETYYYRIMTVDKATNTTAGPAKNFIIDTAPPIPPTPLAPADGASTGTTAVAFSWTAGSDALSGLDAGAYQLQVDTSPLFVAPIIDQPEFSSTADTQTLPANDTYYWRIRALDNAGNIAYSATRLLVVDTTPPIAGAPVSPSGVETSATTLIFTWTAGSDTHTSVASYRIQVDTSGGTFAAPVRDSNAGLALTGAVAIYGSDTFRWRVLVTDRAGNQTASDSALFIIDTMPPVAAVLTAPANAAETRETTIAFSWTSAYDTHSGLASHRLQIDTTGAFTSLVADSNAGLATSGAYALAGNRTYYWRIVATDSLGNIANSIARSFTIDTHCTVALTAPADSAIQDSRPVFQWTGSGAETYIWQIDAVAAFTSIVDSLTLTGLSHQAAGLDSGTYYWRVIAYDRVGNFDTSASRHLVIDTAMTDSWAPNAFSLVSPANSHDTGGAAVTFRWNQTTDSGKGVAAYRWEAVLYGGSFAAPFDSITLGATAETVARTLPGSETYQWRVVAIDGAGLSTASSETWTIRVDTTSPVPGALAAPPANNETGATVAFSWNTGTDAHSGVASYRLQVSASPAFGVLLVDSSTGTALSAVRTLVGTETYYWRVVVVDNVGCTAASESRAIRIDTTPPVISRAVFLDTATNVIGPRIQVVATDNFGLDTRASYRITGDITDADKGQWVAYSSTDTLERTIQLTADSGTKTCTITVRDRFGNISVETAIQTRYETGSISVIIQDTATPIAFSETMAPAPGETVVVQTSTGETLVTMTSSTTTPLLTLQVPSDTLIFQDTRTFADIISLCADTTRPVALVFPSDSILLYRPTVASNLVVQNTISTGETLIQFLPAALLGNETPTFTAASATETFRFSLPNTETMRLQNVRFQLGNLSGNFTDTTNRGLGNVGDQTALKETVREFRFTDSSGRQIENNDTYFPQGITLYLPVPAAYRNNSSMRPFYFRTTDSTWVNILDDSTMVMTSATDSWAFAAGNDSMRVIVRHFTFIGISAADWPAQNSLSNVVVYPNPYVPYDGNAATGIPPASGGGVYIGNLTAGARIKIYDIRGRLVHEATNGAGGAMLWSARNKDNQEVASGVYLIVIEAGGQRVVKKAAVVR
jgi:hypothetical protein